MATPQNAVSSQCTCETRLNELTSQITKLAELVESQKKTITLLEKRVTDLECIPRSPQCGSRPSFFAATLDDSPVQTPSMPTTFAVQPPQSDDVTALESADLFKLVESCALDFLRSNPTLRQGEWCTDCEGPCTSFKLPQAEHTSTSSSAVTAPAATNNSSVSVVNVGGEQVSVDELLANPALQFLMQNPKKNGRWCKGHPETTSPENCSFVHRKHDVEGQTLLVEGTPVPLGALVRNKAVEMLLTHPVGSEGQWCHSDDATHDVTICYRVHRRENAKNGRSSPTAEQDKKRNSGGCDAGAATPTPADGYVLVADARVSVSDLKHNLAVEYLMKNPTKRGRWCSLPKDHDAAVCNFVHPKADSACSSPATAAPVKAEDEATLVDENGIRCVRVGTDLIPVTRLARNPAVDYLLAHPHRRGRWCHGHGEKQIQECTFVHTKTDSTKDTTAGGKQESSSTNPSNGNTQDTLTTRMVVYYEADSPGSA